jgi:hypothetical protein
LVLHRSGSITEHLLGNDTRVIGFSRKNFQPIFQKEKQQ